MGRNMKKVYLGDSVYAETDGAGIILTTENGLGMASNTIYLELSVYDELCRYVEKLKAEAKERRDADR
jgi:hypothetical protein